MRDNILRVEHRQYWDGGCDFEEHNHASNFARRYPEFAKEIMKDDFSFARFTRGTPSDFNFEVIEVAKIADWADAPDFPEG